MMVRTVWEREFYRIGREGERKTERERTNVRVRVTDRRRECKEEIKNCLIMLIQLNMDNIRLQCTSCCCSIYTCKSSKEIIFGQLILLSIKFSCNLFSALKLGSTYLIHKRQNFDAEFWMLSDSALFQNRARQYYCILSSIVCKRV